MDTPKLSSVPQRLSRRLSPFSTSSSPLRSPTAQRIPDDLLADLSPATTLEAFTSPSGKLRESIEAATPVERAFGIRATLASKKIQEWVDELSAWPWPQAPGPEGFELPSAKQRKMVYNPDERQPRSGYPEPKHEEIDPSEYMGSLPTQDALAYEVRVEEIQEDMDDLNVEEIKRTVLNNFFSASSRPSSSSSSSNTLAPPPFITSYTKMDDFTAVVAATVLQALPNLSRLMRLMDVWSTRLSVLRKIAPLMLMLDDAEVALKSGWQAIHVPEDQHSGGQSEQHLERAAFEIMRNVLQDKVTKLGQDLDRMLDRLEGREDTLPDHWLDRMEAIETNYGNWVVSGDRKVREGEWARMALRKKEEAEKLRVEEEAREVASLQAEKSRTEQEEKRKLGVEAMRLKAELARKEKEEALRIEREFQEEVAQLEQERVQRIIDEERQLQKDAQAQSAEIAKQKALRDAEQIDVRELFESKVGEHPKPASAGDQPERLSRIIVFDGVPYSSDDKATSAIRGMHGLDGNSESKFAEPDFFDLESTPKVDCTRERASMTGEDSTLEQNLATRPGDKIQPHSPESAASKDKWMITQDLMLGLSGGAVLDKTTEARLARKFGTKSEADVPETKKWASINEDMVVRNAAFREQHNLQPPRNQRRSKFSEFDGTDDWNQEDEESDTCKDLQDTTDKTSDQKLSTGQDQPPSPVQQFKDQSPPGPVDDVFPSRSRSPSSPSRAALSRNTSMRNSPQLNRRLSLPPSTTNRLRSDSSGSWISSPLVPDDVWSRRKSKSSDREQVESPAVSNSSMVQTDHQEKIPQVDGDSGVSKRILSSPELETTTSLFNQTIPPKRHSRNISLISEYSISQPSPEIQEAEPKEYFRHQSLITTPSKTSKNGKIAPAFSISPTMIVGEVMPTLASSNSSVDQSDFEPQSSVASLDGANESILHNHELGDYDECYSPSINNLSPASEQTPCSPIRNPNDSSGKSLVSTPTGEELSPPALQLRLPRPAQDVPEVVPLQPHLQMQVAPTLGEDVPRASESRHSTTICHGLECNCTCPHCSEQSRKFSDQTVKTIPENLWKSEVKKSRADSFSLDMPPLENPDTIHSSSVADRMIVTKSSPIIRPNQTTVVADIPPTTDVTADTVPVAETPLISNLDIAHPIGSSQKKGVTTDDQIQAQLSSLLASIPTNIKLSDEAAADTPPPSRFSASSQNDSLKVGKTRRSLPSFVRPSSSLSTRSPSSLSIRSATPAFTLQPATKHAAHRNGTHPEIRVYHLSRHGDAPIKLHIRRVGEGGERLMVRTGGGWADLGEYLTAYISHHGRRIASGLGEDKVEVENLGAGMRSVSSSSAATIRARTSAAGGRESPGPSRPGSVLGMDRPVSSLYVRKTRRSVGEYSEHPSTPQQHGTPPSTKLHTSNETPDSNQSESRPVSRMSWTGSPEGRSQSVRGHGDRMVGEQGARAGSMGGLGGLGLAGPNSRTKDIGRDELEWVRSTTEKVRIASAEKERAKEGKKDNGGRFGEEKRRLFKS